MAGVAIVIPLNRECSLDWHSIAIKFECLELLLRFLVVAPWSRRPLLWPHLRIFEYFPLAVCTICRTDSHRNRPNPPFPPPSNTGQANNYVSMHLCVNTNQNTFITDHRRTICHWVTCICSGNCPRWMFEWIPWISSSPPTSLSDFHFVPCPDWNCPRKIRQHHRSLPFQVNSIILRNNSIQFGVYFDTRLLAVCSQQSLSSTKLARKSLNASVSLLLMLAELNARERTNCQNSKSKCHRMFAYWAGKVSTNLLLFGLSETQHNLIFKLF